MAIDNALKSTVLNVANKLARSAETMDVKEFENLLHDEYMELDPEGKRQTKRDRVNEWQKQAFKAASVNIDEIEAHQVGDNIIVTGVSSVKATQHGRDISGKYRFTQVLVHRNGGRLTAATKESDLAMVHCTSTKTA